MAVNGVQKCTLRLNTNTLSNFNNICRRRDDLCGKSTKSDGQKLRSTTRMGQTDGRINGQSNGQPENITPTAMADADTEA